MRLLLLFVLVISSALLLFSVLSGPLGLGEREDFVLYRHFGASRSVVAFWATVAIAVTLAALMAIRAKLAGAVFAFAKNETNLFRQWLAEVCRTTAPTTDGSRPKEAVGLSQLALRLFACARQLVGAWMAGQLRRIRAYRPSALDVVAMLIIAAYGALCWSTVFHAYRGYEEVWTFETDGPFYLHLLDLLAHGELRPSAFYGYFPILAAYVFSIPVRVFNWVFGSGDLITSLIVGFRVSQIFFVLLAGWLVYLIASSLSSRPLAIVCLVSFFSVSEFLKWTIYIHPDVQQVSMTLAGCYCLIRYLESREQAYFFVSAIFAGLATASKYFGVFLVPAAAVAALAVYLPQCRLMTAVYRSAVLSALYAGVHIIAYLIATPPLLRRPLRSLRYMTEFHSGEGRVVFGNAISADLWQHKAKLLFDNAFLGKTICIAFAVAVVWTVATSIVRKRIDGVHILTTIILSYCIVFLALWGDLFNINGGYRYLLQPVALMPIVIAVALNDAGRLLGAPGRVAAVAAAVWILVLIIPNSLPMRARYVSETLSYSSAREQTGQFQIRGWLEENVPDGAQILTQAYTNIQMPGAVPGHYFEQGGRWRGRKDIKVFYDPSNHVYLTPQAVTAIDPDFIVGVNETAIAEILAKFPSYQLVTKLGERGVVFVVGRKAL